MTDKKNIMQEPLTVVNITINNEIHSVKVYGNVDKIDMFYYYTFVFNDGNNVVLSKFDGTEWKIANSTMNNHLVDLLGKIIDIL